MVRKSIILVAASTLLFPARTRAQDRSAVRQMLDRAHASLNDLRFLRADTIARDVLSLAILPRAARAEALELLAAANFPESNPDRRPAQARSAITELLALDISNTIPRELSWRGLDSLYQDVLSRTYGMSVSVRRENSIVGIDGTAPLRVRVNEPSVLSLRARTKDGIESVLMDSVPVATDTVLSFRVSRGGIPILRDGEYEFIVTATQLATRETLIREYDGTAAVPGISYVLVPQKVDSSKLRPERSKPQRALGISSGVVLGAATIAIGAALRAGDPIRNSGQSDSRYVSVAVLMAAGVGLASWFDHGRVLDKNTEANRRILRDMAQQTQAARDENARRAAAYRASITVNPEAR